MQSPCKPEKERQPEIRPNSKSDEPAGKDVEGGPMTLVQRKRRGRKYNVILGSSSRYKGNIKSRGRYVSLFVSRLDPVIEPMELKSYIIVQGQMYHIPKNLASNVNLSYCMHLWTLRSKLQQNYCWTFFQ